MSGAGLSKIEFFGDKPWPLMSGVGLFLTPWAWAWGNDLDIVLMCAAIGVIGAAGWLRQSIKSKGKNHDA